jgi:hypothetical protein
MFGKWPKNEVVDVYLMITLMHIENSRGNVSTIIGGKHHPTISREVNGVQYVHQGLEKGFAGSVLSNFSEGNSQRAIPNGWSIEAGIRWSLMATAAL